jgi:hypothetical protein
VHAYIVYGSFYWIPHRLSQDLSHYCFWLLQNPPSVPTLVAVKWASWLRNAKFIVDWHNFGYTLLALSLGRNSRFVTVYRWYY